MGAKGLALVAALAALPGCGLSLTVAGIVVATQDSGGSDSNLPPTASVQTPVGLVNDIVAVSYTLIDPESDAASIDVRWSTDDGATWSPSPATAATGLAEHSGTTGLSTSAAGTPHTFLWNSFVDLGSLGAADNYSTVRLRFQITQSDGQGNTVSSNSFPVYNRYTATVAGAQGAQFLDAIVTPGGMARRPNGNLIVADLAGQKVVEVDAITGALTVIAGTGLQGFNGDNQPATQAQLDFPVDVAIDPQGNVYICDAGNAAIRYVDAATGFITTVVGNNGWGFSGDGGAASGAALAGPEGLSIDLNGDLWIADTQNDRIRFVNRSTVNRTFQYWNGVATTTITVTPGQIQTIAGGGSLGIDNISPLNTQLRQPRDVVPIMFGVGTVNVLLGYLISDWGNDRVRVVNTLQPADGLPGSVGNFYGEFTPNGQIRTVAGGGNGGGATGGVGDGGPARLAVLRGPQKLALFYHLAFWVADTGNNRAREVYGGSPNGFIVTVAGTGAFGYSGDGRIPQLATLAAPIGVLLDPSFNQIVADTFNGRIRLINPQAWTDLAAPTTTDVIAVGGTGSYIRGAAGQGFVPGSVGDVQMLGDVSATGSNDVVVVGDQGLIRRWNGSAWAAEASGTTRMLLGVHALNTTNNFAVGSGGTVLFYNGSNWTQQAAGLTAMDLRAVHAAAANDVYAVGDYDGGNARPTVLRYNGSSWSIATGLPSLPVGTDLYAVHGSATNNVIVVGDDGQSPAQPVVLRWNGSTWTDLSSQIASDAGTAGVTLHPLRGVFVSSAAAAVAVGNSGLITAWNGSTFAFPTPPTNNDLAGVAGTGSNNIYVIGSNDTLLHYGGGQWNTLLPNSGARYAGVTIPALMIESITQPPTTGVIAVSSPQSVVTAANGDVIFSNTGTHEVLRLDIQTRAITSVAGTGGPGFAGDNGAAGPAANLVGEDLFGVWGPSASDLWAVGAAGVIIHYNGSAWSVTRAAADTQGDLLDVHGTGSSDAWAVGNGGAIWHWDGTAWTAQTSPTTEDLRAVFALSTTDAFAVGRRGVICRFNGTAWTQMAGGSGSSGNGPIRDFQDVWAASGSDAWAVGDGSVNPNQGPVWHWNGTAWSRDGTLPSGLYPIGFRSVYGFGSQDVYVVGEGAVILHWHDPDGAGTGQPLAWYSDSSLGSGAHLNDVFGRSGGGNPGADLFVGGEFGNFAAGAGADSWQQNLTPNDTIGTTVTLHAGIAFSGGSAAFVVGANGTVYRQPTPGAAWLLQLGSGQLSSPRGLALWQPASGGPILFLADEDNSRIRAVNLGTGNFTLYPFAGTPIVIPAGGIVTAVGGATGGSAPFGDGGFATAAELANPYGVAVDPANGNLYVADTAHHTVRVVAATNGVISKVGGNYSAGFGGDGAAATGAQFDTPTGLSCYRTDASTAELYIADSLNHRIRVVNLGTGSTTIGGITINSGNIATVAGSGTGGFNSDGLAPTASDLAIPTHALRAGGTIYIADSENHRIRAMPVTGAGITLSTVGGTGQAGYGGDPKPAAFALFNTPFALGWDPAAASLYVADTDNSRVRRFRP